MEMNQQKQQVLEFLDRQNSKPGKKTISSAEKYPCLFFQF